MKEYLCKCWVGWACGIAGSILVGAVATCRRKYKARQCKFNAMELGVQALLRSQIIHTYNKYMDLKEMPIYERENIDQLFAQYENLGGNGTIKDLVGKLKNLPTPCEKKEETI